MVLLKEIKKLAKNEGKKIGKESVKKIEENLTKEAEKLIKSASRNADFSGRKIIKPEDIE